MKNNAKSDSRFGFVNSTRPSMKKLLVILLLGSTGSTMAICFWNQELKYIRPTPVPPNYKLVAYAKRWTFIHTSAMARTAPFACTFSGQIARAHVSISTTSTTLQQKLL